MKKKEITNPKVLHLLKLNERLDRMSKRIEKLEQRSQVVYSLPKTPGISYSACLSAAIPTPATNRKSLPVNEAIKLILDKLGFKIKEIPATPTTHKLVGK